MFAQKASERCIVLFIFRELEWESCGKEGEVGGDGGLDRCIFVGAVALRIQQNERDTKGRFN